LVDQGEGYVATGGKYLPIRWSKAASDQPIELMDSSGARILLAPGHTWIELVPGAGSGVPEGIVTIQ